MSSIIIESGSELVGALPPQLSGLSYLTVLVIRGANFSKQGGYPKVVSQLTRLWRLDLSANLFGGVFYSPLGALTRLETFVDVGNNYLKSLDFVSLMNASM